MKWAVQLFDTKGLKKMYNFFFMRFFFIFVPKLCKTRLFPFVYQVVVASLYYIREGVYSASFLHVIGTS